MSLRGRTDERDVAGTPLDAVALLTGVVLGCGAVLAACGVDEPAPLPGDDGDATPTAAPSPSPAPTPSPSPASTSAPEGAGDLEVHFIDVGQGDATLLRAPDATVLVDAGRHDRSDVVPYLDAVGVEALDVVAITHPHADHIGQFDELMARVDVAEVWWSGATHTTQTFERAVAALEASDAAYEEPRAGGTTTVGSLEFAFVNPPEDADFEDLHDSNLAFRVTYGEGALLFTGDAEASTEQRMVDRDAELLASDVYQVGHHGSRTSTTAGFLDAVDPTVAVYSAGVDNQYGHPHAVVLDRLHAAGADVYGTDVHGTVTAIFDGTAWRVETTRPGTPASGDTEDDGGQDPESACVDLNTASSDDLQSVIHIGSVRAQAIMDGRPWGSVDELLGIDGIGPARLTDIREQGLAATNC